MRYLTNDEVMFYGTVAGGYRPGGTNETVFEEFPDCREQLGWFGLTGIPLTYESDSLWSYELGVKSGWAARRIFLNAAVFYIDWSDMQTPAGLFCGANWVQNAGEATSKGAELELVAYPGRNLELTLNGTWTDARLDEDVPLMNGREGDRVPGVPEYAFGGSLSWFFDVSDGLDGSIRVDYQYVGSSPDGYSYWPWNQPGKILSYSLVNLHLSLGKGRWRVVLYARNLFDERAIITMHDDAAGPYVTTARPFTAGIRASLVY
jgi:outer membrane receptor protein involved in Fe transport